MAKNIMNPNLIFPFTSSPSASPEQLQKRTGKLIRLYIKYRDPSIAITIARHINALLSHPGYVAENEQRCLMRRMATHWRCLAWFGGLSVYPEPAEKDSVPLLRVASS